MLLELGGNIFFTLLDLCFHANSMYIHERENSYFVLHNFNWLFTSNIYISINTYTVIQIEVESMLRGFWMKLKILSKEPLQGEREWDMSSECISFKILDVWQWNPSARQFCWFGPIQADLPKLLSWRLLWPYIKDFKQNLFWTPDAYSFTLQESHWKYFQFHLKILWHTVASKHASTKWPKSKVCLYGLDYLYIL